MVWLQVDTFPLERQLRDFLMREVWVPIPPHPCVDSLSVTQQGRGRGASWLSCSGEKKRFQFTASLRLRKMKLRSSGAQRGAMTFSLALLLKVDESVTENK